MVYDSYDALNLEEVPAVSIKPIRVTLPASDENLRQMIKKGYCLVDRTLRATINLKNSKTDFQRNVRMQIERISFKNDEEICRIAKMCFQQDRRFFISLEKNKELTDCIIEEYLNKMEECFVCLFKGVSIGFLSVKEDALKKYEGIVYLAAVLEQYRRTGAAMSLYSFAAQECKERGVHSLLGRISSQNTAVMNLYVSLGASFSDPRDVFIKG